MDDIRSIVHDLIERISKSSASDVIEIETVFMGLLNPNERQHVRFDGVSSGKIAVLVESSGWLFHFRTRKAGLLKKIRQRFKDSETQIKDIQIKIGKFS